MKLIPAVFIQLLLSLSFMLSTDLTYAQDLWIDVRSAEEFNAGHLKGAVHIPYEEIAQRISELTTDKNTKIHLYCRSGRRSGIALETLKSQGFTQVINEGGYEDLVKKP